MNKQGASVAIAFMLAVTLIILAIGSAPTINQVVNETMYENRLDCENASISDFDKGACVTTDTGQFLFIGGLIVLALAMISQVRKLF